MGRRLKYVRIIYSIFLLLLLADAYAKDASDNHIVQETHDFVIVGGGTAGLTLGYLMEKDGLDVVVLEAGRDRDNDPNIREPKPIGALESGWRNEYFWLENGKPQENLPYDSAHYSGGRILGGSSAINDSIYWRGMQRTYDKWGGLFAEKNYVRNVFVASETYTGMTQDAKSRGTSGPFSVMQGRSTPIGDKWVTAMREVLKQEYKLDVPIVDDIHVVNGPALSSRVQLYIDPKTKMRVSSSSGLLKKRNSRLDVRLMAMVTTIGFKNGTAYKVNYIQNGVSKLILARKKIILCAGINSSKILQLSGIGGADELHAAGVDVVFDNPKVGKNLTNHLLLTVIARVNPADNKEISADIASKQLGGVGAVPDPGFSDPMERYFEFATVNPKPGISAFAILLNYPESRGVQKIVSKDPLAPAVVDFNYLKESIDRERLVRGLEIMRKTIEKIAESDPKYRIISDISNPEKYVTTNTKHIHHFSGTNAIGAVVDEKLHVMGVANLMVADLSISPTTVRGHTHAAAILIGAAAYTVITGNKQVTFN